MDHVQGGQQPRQFGSAIELCAGQGITGQPRTVEFPVQALLHLLQLCLQNPAQVGMGVEFFARRQAQQHRQRGLQRMAKVAQGIARALETVFGMRQQMVDLCHQRLQLPGHLCVQLRTLALLQLGDLLTSTFQRTQGSPHRDALQQQNHQQPRQPQPQANLAHALEARAHRGVIQGHADGNRLPQAPVVRTQYQ
ncbi:hypothetical protein D3C84_377600 [compost metagenome]